jgi:hypothetical protein
MKKLALVMVAAFAVTGLVFAQAAGPKGGAKGGVQGGATAPGGQRPAGGGMRRGGMFGDPKAFAEVSKKLGLTKAQETKIQAIQKDFSTKMESMRPKQTDKPKAGATPGERPKMDPEMMKKFQAAFEDYNKKINAVLTVDQQKKLEAYRKEMRAKMGAGRPGGPGAPGGPGGAAAGAAGKGKSGGGGF